MKVLRLTVLVTVVILGMLAVQPPRVALAGATGSWSTLSIMSFFGPCSDWTLHGGIITTTLPANYTLTLTDGDGITRATFSGSLPVGNLTSTGAPFQSQPTKNPIHALLIIDGTIVANVSADSHCLPSSGNTVKFFDPGDDRLNREPGQPAALYCRDQGVHIYEVNVDDSKGKIVLVVTKAEIDAVVNAIPSANTLIKQSADGRFKLFYLPAGKELSFITHELRSGKQYSHVWKGLCR
jgi:hypothetical protein